MTEKRNSPGILCAGQAVVDCVTRGITQDAHGAGKRLASGISLRVGGDAVNEALALAGMGRRVGLVCGIGEDAAGQLILGQAQAGGVDVSGVSVLPGLQTPVADIFVEEDGSRSSISSRATLLPGYVPSIAELLRSAGDVRVVSLASLFRAPLDDPAVIARLIREAHEAGALVCADAKLPTFRKTTLEELADVLPLVDCFFPNEEEALYYTGRDTVEEAAEALLNTGIGTAVIKRGEKGCFAARGSQRLALPAVPVRVVDTTGAGDSLAAGYIDALLEGKDLRECCEAGMKAAAERIGKIR